MVGAPPSLDFRNPWDDESSARWVSLGGTAKKLRRCGELRSAAGFPQVGQSQFHPQAALGVCRMGVTNLWSLSGTTSRKKYFLVGAVAFLLKSNLDRLVATYFFHRPWGLLNYWFPFPWVTNPRQLAGADARLSAILVSLSIPFIWLGIAQTVRRLRDCRQPLWLSALFFVPFANLMFFAVLCCWPPAERDRKDLQNREQLTRSVERIGQPDAVVSALLAIFSTTVLGTAATALGTQYMRNYGWGLFVAVPFCLGLLSTLIYSYCTPRTVGECLLVSITPVMMMSIGLVLLAFEGVLCVVMAAPLGLILSIIGGLVGHGIQQSRWRIRQHPAMMGMVLMIMPLCMALDPKIQGEPPVLKVSSSLEINAPPEVVWNKVVSFTEIPEQREWLFRTGIAYPVRATLTGTGAGAVRRCEFSTGAFVEPIEVWDEPQLLRFGVTENPAPMEELTPYHHIETPHLNGYFVSHEGQFGLMRLAGNRTRLTGTTWYTDRVWPCAYWQVWSDYIIHRIHLRVLRHIQAEAEKAARIG
jgi:uncharacterized membrane protein YhaH (DUF805 family)